MSETALKLAELMTRPDRLLVVDDEIIVRMTFMDMTTKYQLYVDAVGSVEESLVLLQRRAYDYIFLDMKLDGSDGMEVLRFIDNAKMDAHVTIMSGSIKLSDVMREANQMGVLSFFNKPVSFSTTFLERILPRIGVRLVPLSRIPTENPPR
jgi:DNA-binding NtrC family response regulator